MKEETATQNKPNDLKKKTSEPLPSCSFFNLFRFATQTEKVLMILGSIAAAGNGVTQPMFSYIFGNMTDSFGGSSSADDTVRSSGKQAIWLLVLGAISFFLSWFSQGVWMTTGERQAIRFRKEYFKAIISQEIGWFDSINPNQLATSVATQALDIQGAIGEKVTQFVFTIFTCLGGFFVGYLRGWELSLICTSSLPFLIVCGFLMTWITQNTTSIVQVMYLEAGGRAEQALTAIKTVKSLNGEEFEMKQYEKSLIKASLISIKFGFLAALAMGFSFCVMFLDYSLAFYYGSIILEHNRENDLFNRTYTVGDILTIFFSIIMGGFSIGQATPCLKSFAKGKEAGFQVFKVIDRKPRISENPNGIKPNKIQGQINLKDVHFTYPTKQDVKVLKGINLIIEANKKTAIVGESGSGKSTIIQLIERFYDIDSGSITIDGVEIKDYNLKQLREYIGYVGQEPTLFGTSIKENLMYGKETATEEEMINALKQANAWDFVNQLDKKLDTFVGTSGSQFSGGQKQRLCIARAILKNPQILLLDEATSALDRQNEQAIQKTLDEISKGRTTIVVAHRLTTVQNSDKIVVLDQGQIVEEGTHSVLFNKGGKYEALIKNQIFNEDEAEENEDFVPPERLDMVQLKKQISQKSEVSKVAKKMSADKLDQQLKQSKLKSAIQDKSKKYEMTEEEKKARQAELKAKSKFILPKLLTYNKPEKIWIILGGICAAIQGGTFPIAALPLGELIIKLGSENRDDEWRDDVNLWCLIFVFIAIGVLVFFTLQLWFFTIVGEKLTFRLRKDTFQKMINMQVKWFDIPKNNPGTLAARLSSDAQQVNIMTTTVIGITIGNIFTFIVGMIIAFFYSWRVTLVCIAISPLVMVAGQLQMQWVQGFSAQTDEAYKDSGQLIMETVTNIRTVKSFGHEETLMKFLELRLAKAEKFIVPKANKAGLAFAFSNFMLFGMYALTFYVGAIFQRDYGSTPKGMFVSIFAIMMAAMGAGQSNQFMGDVGTAQNSALNIFEILDCKDEYQLNNEICKNQLKEGKLNGNIEFRNVTFKYPSRDEMVLKGISFTIKAGQKVAFCGPSGCGKSTIMQLIQRFYDIQSGEIFVDGKNIFEYDIKFLRSQYGVVSQEPVLFNGTIQENIQYNGQNIKFEDIKLAAQRANALGFIEKNDFQVVEQPAENQNKDNAKPKTDLKNSYVKNQMAIKNVGSGFDRQVGPKGQQISGGQKQRIAIARAILKNPQILILDEATSALDTENEKIVQESLDNIMKDKTSLCVAHRISTIKDSDRIYVMEEGEIKEYGNYEELIAKKGFFYRLERGETK